MYDRQLSRSRAADKIDPAYRQLLSWIDSGRDNPQTFARLLLGMRGLHDGQLDVVRLLEEKPFGTIAASNGWGKTTGWAIVLLWITFYRKWAPKWWGTYRGVVLGPEMKHALIVHQEIEAMRNHRHPGQYFCDVHGNCELGPECPQARKHRMVIAPWLTPYKTEESNKDHQAFYWKNRNSKLYFESSEEKAKAIEGWAINFVIYDELRHELYLKHVVEQVLLARGVRAPDMRIVLSSTPVADNFEFEDFWKYAERPDKQQDWWHRMGNIEENTYLVKRQVATIARQLDERIRAQVMRGEFVAPPEAYFIPDRIRVVLPDDRPEDSALAHLEGKFERGHTYVAGADQAVSEASEADVSVVTVWDVTELPYRRVFKKEMPRGTATSQLRQFTDAVIDEFGGCQLGYDANGPLGPELRLSPGSYSGAYVPVSFGGRKALEVVDARKSVRTTGSKSESLANYRKFINEAWVLYGNDPVLRGQLRAYKLDDKHLRTDHLMSEVNCAWVAKDYLPVGAHEGGYLDELASVYNEAPVSYGVGMSDELLTPSQQRWRAMIRADEERDRMLKTAQEMGQ